MNIIYLGQKRIGGLCLSKLFNQINYDHSGDVSYIIGDPEIYKRASNLGIPCSMNNKRHEDQIFNVIERDKIDVILSVKHPFILSEKVINAVGGRAYNLHCGKLPEYQGWNACTHSILNEENSFTVTIHRIAPKVDTGDIILTQEFVIGDSDTAGSIDSNATICGVNIFEKLIDLLKKNTDLKGTPQTGVPYFYDRSLHKEMSIHIGAAKYMARMARAFAHPDHSPTFFEYNGIKYGVKPL